MSEEKDEFENLINESKKLFHKAVPILFLMWATYIVVALGSMALAVWVLCEIIKAVFHG